MDKIDLVAETKKVPEEKDIETEQKLNLIIRYQKYVRLKNIQFIIFDKEGSCCYISILDLILFL